MYKDFTRGSLAFKCSVDIPSPDVAQCMAKLSCVDQSFIGLYAVLYEAFEVVYPSSVL